jgi:GAF domain-containing protein
MAAWIRRLLTTPVFEDEEKTRVAWLLNTTLLALLVVLVVVVVFVVAFLGLPTTAADLFTLLSGLVLTIAIAGLLFLTRHGYVRLTSTILLALLWLVITAWFGSVSGISGDNSSLIYALIIVLAGLLLGGRAAVVLTLLSTAAVVGAYYAETSGLLVVERRPVVIMDLLLTAVPLILTGLLLRYAVQSMVGAIERANRNERAQIEANRELETLRASLEQRVADRTSDLERRTAQLRAAAEVSRAITSILDAAQLIWQVAALIHNRFDLYHVGLFQMDTTGRWAEYRAGAGEGGHLLAEQQFRLEVGSRSMVGRCTAQAHACVAQDVSAESGRVDHPLVPATRSEAALPLIARGQVVGALSVQSDHPSAFDPETVAILQTIADQVAIALDNARLFAESQQALEATRRAYGELSRQAWADRLRTRTDWGYSYMAQSIAPAQGDWQPEMLQAAQTGQTVLRQAAAPSNGKGRETAPPVPSTSEGPVPSTSEGPVPSTSEGPVPSTSEGPVPSTSEGTTEGRAEGSVLAIPLKVREETIGVLSFCRDTPSGWTARETRLLERLVQQMGVALESAQFYEETQRRAIREQIAREVTARMRETLDVDAVLRTAASEMRQALGLSSMTIQLTTPPAMKAAEAATSATSPEGEH